MAIDFSAWLQQVGADFAHQTPWDVAALVTGVIYVVLSAQNKRVCWVFGFISTTIVAVMSYHVYKLYADAALNVFYAVMAMVGWWSWGEDGEEQLPLSRLSTRLFIRFICLSALVTILVSYLLNTYTEASFVRLDALTSVFSIMATIMMVKRVIQGWWVWIFANMVYVYLYLISGAAYFALLMLVYTILSIYGCWSWTKYWQRR